MAENQDFAEIDGFTHEHQDPSQPPLEESKAPLQKASDLKKPQSAFALYLTENKDTIRTDLKAQGLSHTAFLSEASKKWNVLTAEQKQKYVEMANKHKDKYLKALAAIKERGEGEEEEEADGDEANQQRRKFMQLPLNRIRQLCQKDDDYNLVNKPALVILTKATELFISDLAGVCAQISKQQKRKTLQVNDIVQAAANIDKFHFIKESRLPALNPRKAEEQSANREIQRIIEEEMAQTNAAVRSEVRPLGAQRAEEDEEMR